MFRLMVELAELAFAYVVIAFLLKLLREYFSRSAGRDDRAPGGADAGAGQRRDFGGRGGNIVDAEWEEIKEDPPAGRTRPES